MQQLLCNQRLTVCLTAASVRDLRWPKYASRPELTRVRRSTGADPSTQVNRSRPKRGACSRSNCIEASCAISFHHMSRLTLATLFPHRSGFAGNPPMTGILSGWFHARGELDVIL